MRLRLFVILVALAAASFLCAPRASGDVLLLCHYDSSVDADFSAKEETKAVALDSGLTSGGVAFPDVRTPKALDVSYSRLSNEARVEYSNENIFLRSGTVEMWVKSNFDWDARGNNDSGMECCFFSIAMEGGRWHNISLYYANSKNWGYRPHLAFYTHDGKDHMTAVRLDAGGPLADLDMRRDTWHYVVAAWSPLQTSLFVDGKLAARKTWQPAINFTSPRGPLIIGNRIVGDYRAPARSLVDELRITSRPLFAGVGSIPVPERRLTTDVSAYKQPRVVESGGPAAIRAREPVAYPCHKISPPPKLDGDISDAIWKSLPRASGFVAIDSEHRYVTAQTTIRAAYDTRNLYLAIECHEDHTDKLIGRAAGHDVSALFADDAVEIFLGPWSDRAQDYFQLAFNSGKGSYDGRGTDQTWNGNWQRATKRNDESWTAEVVVPFSTLGASAPQDGTIWRWNVARDRAAAGAGENSSWAPLNGAFHLPEEFNELAFRGAPSDPRDEEAQLNADYLTAARKEIIALVNRGKRELLSGERLLRGRKPDESVTAARVEVEKLLKPFSRLVDATKVELDDWNRARLRIAKLTTTLDRYAEAVNQIGFHTPGRPPAELPVGATQRGQYWFLRSERATAAIDSATGVLCGLWDKSRPEPYILWSHDLYWIEIHSGTMRSDERVDEVVDVNATDSTLELICRNPDLHGVTLRKRYSFVAFEGERRILSRQLEVSGSPAERTLLRVTSRTAFEPTFRDGAYYHTVFPIGTIGDQRSLIWAREMHEPLIRRAWFNSLEGRAEFCAVNPQLGRGIAQYYYKRNGRWVYPQALNSSFWTSTGWDMAWMAAFISQKPKSAEMRYHLFAGDRVDFHREFNRLPEYRRLVDAVPPHPLVKQTRYALGLGRPGIEDPKNAYGIMARFALKNMRSREHDVGLSMPHDVRWGDFPSGDGAKLQTRAGRPPSVRAESIKETARWIKKNMPRIHPGFYNFIMDLSRMSKAYEEHPEWVLKDKTGKPIPGYFGATYVRANWCPAYQRHLTERLLAQLDYYEVDVLYLDFSVGVNFTDWERGVVVQTNDYLRWLGNLYREVSKRGKFLFLNAFTGGPFYDFGYWEGCGKKLDRWGGWRNAAEVLMMRKIYERPGSRTIPLYWYGGEMFGDRVNYREYTNMILSHCMMPTGCWHDPYNKHFRGPDGQTDWEANLAHQLCYGAACLEVAETQWADVDLRPAWWCDFHTDIEAYAFEQGSTHIITVLNHEKQRRDVTLSVDSRKMGFAPDRPVFIWQFYPRDPDAFPRRGGPQPEGWDRLCTKRTCKVIPPPIPARLEILVPDLDPELTRILAVTQSPGVFFSQEGELTQFLLPETLGGAIAGPVNPTPSGYRLIVNVPLLSEVLCCVPADCRKPRIVRAGRDLSFHRVEISDESFLRVTVPAGETELDVRIR